MLCIVIIQRAFKRSRAMQMVVAQPRSSRGLSLVDACLSIAHCTLSSTASVNHDAWIGVDCLSPSAVIVTISAIVCAMHCPRGALHCWPRPTRPQANFCSSTAAGLGPGGSGLKLLLRDSHEPCSADKRACLLVLRLWAGY